jgi:DNA repair exonuclease SbcCD ATPase subunit
VEAKNVNGSLTLPAPLSVRLDSFSLFEREVSVETDFSQAPVFCLVGANGLGKSTFLSAISFAITGAVAEPGRSFRDVGEYHKRAKAYAPKYFRGRIDDRDREAAQVSITMTAGHRRYELTRAVFDGGGLRALTISDIDSGHIAVKTGELDDEERNAVYEHELTKDVGLDGFSQLVFLQLFVLSFDERRELLFWTPKLLQQALYITFGLDPKRAREADKLLRRAEGLESLARNAQWQATNLRNQIELLEAAGEEVLDEVGQDADEQRQLEESRDETVADCESAERAISDAQLDLAEKTATLQALRSEYEEVWNERLQGNGNPRSHPLIISTLEEHRCAACGTSGAEVVAQVQGCLEDERCPLCHSQVLKDQDVDPGSLLDRLGELDREITEVQEAIAALGPRLEELEDELTAAREELRVATQRLVDFEKKNEVAMSVGGDASGGLKAVTDRFRAQIADFQRERDEKRAERDKVREELFPLQESLVLSYRKAEDEFVPSFNELATNFLGLELEIGIEQSKENVGLSLRVEGSERRDVDTLSESQRFFVDIALRMALIQQMSASGCSGCLLVDTPEGSLDIAYESRAGDMFGLFVERGHQLIMVANINTSQLLQRLARRSGKAGLVLQRMTDWTNLSSVQIAEQDAFEQAWRQIIESLDVAPGATKAEH